MHPASQCRRDFPALVRTAILFFSLVLAAQVATIVATYISEPVAWTATNLLRVDLAVFEQDPAQMPGGLATMIGPRGVRLSGGQMQRVAAARIFVRQPRLLVMDDLSSARDVETEELLWKRLSELRDTTCRIVSHRRAAYRRADRIVVLKDGRLEAEGKLEQLLRSSLEFQRLWEQTPV